MAQFQSHGRSCRYLLTCRSTTQHPAPTSASVSQSGPTKSPQTRRLKPAENHPRPGLEGGNPKSKPGQGQMPSKGCGRETSLVSGSSWALQVFLDSGLHRCDLSASLAFVPWCLLSCRLLQGQSSLDAGPALTQGDLTSRALPSSHLQNPLSQTRLRSEVLGGHIFWEVQFSPYEVALQPPPGPGNRILTHPCNLYPLLSADHHCLS